MVYTSFDQLIEKVKGESSASKMAIAAAADMHVLEAVLQAEKEGIVTPILVGDKAAIAEILAELGHTADEYVIHQADTLVECAEKTVALVKSGEADFIMKGMLDTGVLLKAVVNKETGLGLGGTMSILTIFEVPSYHKLLACVDGGMVPYPTLAQKKDIINNTAGVMRAMGYDCPKVGVLACVEKVNPKMPETLEAAELAEMAKTGEIPDCIIEGPISYDCAISKEIADTKGYKSEISGDVDILVAPNIHAGNILGKTLTCSANAKMAGFVTGASCPIVLTSRGSSAEEKFMSIVLASSVKA